MHVMVIVLMRRYQILLWNLLTSIYFPCGGHWKCT